MGMDLKSRFDPDTLTRAGPEFGEPRLIDRALGELLAAADRHDAEARRLRDAAKRIRDGHEATDGVHAANGKWVVVWKGQRAELTPTEAALLRFIFATSEPVGDVLIPIASVMHQGPGAVWKGFYVPKCAEVKRSLYQTCSRMSIKLSDQGIKITVAVADDFLRCELR